MLLFNGMFGVDARPASAEFILLASELLPFSMPLSWKCVAWEVTTDVTSDMVLSAQLVAQKLCSFLCRQSQYYGLAQCTEYVCTELDTTRQN